MASRWSIQATVLLCMSLIYCSGDGRPQQGDTREVAISHGTDTIVLTVALTGQFLERIPAPGGLRPVPDSWVVLTANVKNLSGDTLRLHYGAPPCYGLTAQLLRAHGDYGTRVLRRVIPRVGCVDLTIAPYLAPGDQDTIVSRYTADAVLGDSLDPGTYGIAATFEFDLERVLTGGEREELVSDTSVVLVLDKIDIPRRR